jgi:dynein heavy chain
MQTQTVGGGSAGEEYEMVTDLATDILTKVPQPFDFEAVAEQYPVLYTDSVSTVLRQVSYKMASCIVTFM